jgi:hypothetical protein
MRQLTLVLVIDKIRRQVRVGTAVICAQAVFPDVISKCEDTQE